MHGVNRGDHVGAHGATTSSTTTTKPIQPPPRRSVTRSSTTTSKATRLSTASTTSSSSSLSKSSRRGSSGLLPLQQQGAATSTPASSSEASESTSRIRKRPSTTTTEEAQAKTGSSASLKVPPPEPQGQVSSSSFRMIPGERPPSPSSSSSSSPSSPSINAPIARKPQHQLQQQYQDSPIMISTINSAGIVTSYQSSSSSSDGTLDMVVVESKAQQIQLQNEGRGAPSYHSSSSSSSNESSQKRTRRQQQRRQRRRSSRRSGKRQPNNNIAFNPGFSSDAPSYHSSSSSSINDESDSDERKLPAAVATLTAAAAAASPTSSRRIATFGYDYNDAPSYRSSSDEDDDDNNGWDGSSSSPRRMNSIATTSSTRSNGLHTLSGFSAAPSYQSESSDNDSDSGVGKTYIEAIDHGNGHHADNDPHQELDNDDDGDDDDRNIPRRQSSVFVGAVAIYPTGEHSDTDDNETAYDNLVEEMEGQDDEDGGVVSNGDEENNRFRRKSSVRRSSTRRISSRTSRRSPSSDPSSSHQQNELSSQLMSHKSSTSLRTSTASKALSLLSSLLSVDTNNNETVTSSDIEGSSTTSSNNQIKQRRIGCCLFAFCLVLFLLGGGIALLVSRRDDSDDSDTIEALDSSDSSDDSTPSPTTTLSPTLTKYDFFYQMVDPISGFDDDDDNIDKAASLKALDWLVYNDTRITNFYYYDPNNANIRNDVDSFFGRSFLLERYALAVLYFATDGPSAWKSQLGFLNRELTTCEWESVAIECDQQKRVTSLTIVGNGLNGTIPRELTALSSLERLRIVNNPQLQGNLPFTFFFSSEVSSNLLAPTPQYPLPPKLKELDLSHNSLSGTMPNSMLDNVRVLERIDLSNNGLSGTMVDRIFQLPSLKSLNLQNNKFDGMIPELGAVDNDALGMSLEECLLDNNELVGRVPISLYGSTSTLSRLSLSENFLTGTLPSRQIERLSRLRVLNLDDNLFDGTIPTEIGSLSSLQRFSMYFNIIRGSIPNEIGLLSKLQYLDLGANNLNGLLPSQLSQCSSLKFLSVQGSRSIRGAIPSGMATLPALGTLDIRETGLTDDTNTLGAFCDKIESNALFTRIWADCGGSLPTVECPCCTRCCDTIQRVCTDNLVLNCQIEASRYQHEDGFFHDDPSRQTTCTCADNGQLLSCSGSSTCQSCNEDVTICATNEEFGLRFNNKGEPTTYFSTFVYSEGRDGEVNVILNYVEGSCLVTIENDSGEAQACSRCSLVTCRDGITSLDIDCDNIEGAGSLNICTDVVEGGALSIFQQIDPQHQSSCSPRYRFDQLY